MATSVELRQRRANLWEEAKSLHNLAQKENRELSAEEREQWDRINKDIDALKETIDRMERIAKIDADMEETEEPMTRSNADFQKMETLGSEMDAEEEEGGLPKSKEYKRAYGDYLRYGINGMRADRRAVLQPFYSVSSASGREKRALGVATGAVGGALVAEDFYSKMIDAMVAFGGMRQARTTKITTSTGADMPIPLADDTFNQGAILAEGSAVSTDGVDPSFGSKTLGAYMYTSKLVRVSLQLLQDSAFPFEPWLAAALGRRLGRISNYHFTQGSGTGEPEGLITAAPVGVADADLDLDYFDLISLEHSVDPAYRANGAQWMFHDTTLAVLKQIKAVEDGRPLWLPGLAVNAPDTLLGYGYIINQSMPQAEAEAKAIAFGDLSYYFIRDVQDIRVLRLEERFAEYLQVGFLAFMRMDGVYASPSEIELSSELEAISATPVSVLQFAAEST